MERNLRWTVAFAAVVAVDVDYAVVVVVVAAGDLWAVVATASWK